MQSAVFSQRRQTILYDADRLPRPSPLWFSAAHWPGAQALSGGRGASWLIATPYGPAVLRRARRGGWMAKLSTERYWFSGAARSRSFREWRCLAHLHAHHVDCVPQPWAAYCEQHGWAAEQALLTGFIPGKPLPEWPAGPLAEPELWRRIGALLARLCRTGVAHRDFHLGNILLDDDRRLWILDFDRARCIPGRTFNGRAQIRRLVHSLRRRRERLPTLPEPAAARVWLRQGWAAAG